MKNTKFYVCEHCGNLVVTINNAGVPLVCCGEKMKSLIPNTVDASAEKHVPVVNVDGSTVKVTVGSVAHPMTEAHLISWIYLETDKGSSLKYLTHTDEPSVIFNLAEGETPIAAYAYCNLHGLWKTEI